MSGHSGESGHLLSQEDSHHQELNQGHFDLRLSSLQNWEKIQGLGIWGATAARP